MIPSIRIYESETQAQDAARQLREEDLGLRDDAIAVVSSANAFAPPELVAELPHVFKKLITDNVQQGRAAVAVMPSYAAGARIDAILDSCGPVSVDIPEHKAPQPAPLSDFLGIPPLSDMEPRARIIPGPSGPSFGFRLLSTDAAPLSSLLRLKLLSKPKRPWNSSFGVPLLKDASR